MEIASWTIVWYTIIIFDYALQAQSANELRESAHLKQISNPALQRELNVSEKQKTGHISGDKTKSSVTPAKPVKDQFRSSSITLERFREAPLETLAVNVKRYGKWSKWSECVSDGCFEHRQRRCIDDTWEQPNGNDISKLNCVSKYIAEIRECNNKTSCIVNRAEGDCGIRPTGRTVAPKILGGERAATNAWPWAVRLSTSRPKMPPTTCGGTLIASHWILTAAHCVTIMNDSFPSGKLLNLSSFSRDQLYAHLGGNDKRKRVNTEKVVAVDRAILHPRYNDADLTEGYDVALLYLAEPIKKQHGIGYACLLKEHISLKPGTTFYAVGWGDVPSTKEQIFHWMKFIFADVRRQLSNSKRSHAIQHGRGSDKVSQRSKYLREVKLPMVRFEECAKQYDRIRSRLHICAGSHTKDTCDGDSGGGLFYQMPNSNKWFVVGVTSFGHDLGCGRTPGVYTSVVHHRTWIRKTISETVI